MELKSHKRTEAADFEVQPLLYWATMGIMLLGVFIINFTDLDEKHYFNVGLNYAILGIGVLAIVLYISKRMGRNLSLGILIYASILSFLLQSVETYITLTTMGDPRNELSAKIMYTLFTVSVMMGVTGFIINRFVSLVVGALLLGFITTITFLSGDKLLDYYFLNFPFFIVGFAIILFYYRGRIEKILKALKSNNATLEEQRRELHVLNEKSEQSLAELKKAQTKIVTQEKLASLGALTAGIAHEIKNPLNFITNFAESSIEMFEELKEALALEIQGLEPKKAKDVQYLLEELAQNMKDISDHGKRGDNIVKSMLMHSRGASGVFSNESINRIAEECINLAYHGLRATNTSFQSSKDLNLDTQTVDADVVRADFARVILNLCNNAFYAVYKRKLQSGPEYSPIVQIFTRQDKDFVEVRVQDNGTGIEDEVREKLFTPFFTTKPTGEGTGLGLSLSHDIIVQEHNGSIEVESELGKGSAFIVRIPKVHKPSEK